MRTHLCACSHIYDCTCLLVISLQRVLKTPRSTYARQMIESYRADAFYDAMRFKGHLLRRYHSLTCEPCTREIRDSRVCKTSAIKYDPDALDNLVESFTFKGSRL